MTRLRRFLPYLVLAWAGGAAQGALPSSIALDFVDGAPDTSFDGSTISMLQYSTAHSALVLTDPSTTPSVLSGFSPVAFELDSSFESVIYDGVIPLQRFVGGAIHLAFQDGDDAYSLEASLQSLVIHPPLPGPGFFTIDIEATFVADPSVLNLPGARTWDAHESVSLLNSLSIRIDEDISTLDWPSATPWSGNTLSQFELDEFMSTLLDPETPLPPPWWSIPEPATGLFACFAILLLGLRGSSVRIMLME